MRKLMTLIAMCMFLTTQATPPDSTIAFDFSYNTLVTKPKAKDTERLNTAYASIVAGAVLMTIGIVKEVNRQPYPTHATAINYNPDSPAVLNYMLIGTGIAFTGYGVKLVFDF